MIYLLLFISFILLGILGRLSPYLYFIIAGMTLVFHPILLSKGEDITVKYLSEFVFLVVLTGFLNLAIARLFNLDLNHKSYAFIRQFYQKHFRQILICFVLLILLFALPWDAVLLLLCWLICIGIILRLAPRIFAGFAIFFLSLCPIFLIINKEPLAEQSAIWAYYFLVITVILQIIEFRRSKKFH